jgi:hypothetical protein
LLSQLVRPAPADPLLPTTSAVLYSSCAYRCGLVMLCMLDGVLTWTAHSVGESRRKILLMSSRLSAGLRRLLAKHTPALLGTQSTAWGDSHMLPSRGVRVWVVYLTPKIERIVSLLSASPVGEARCRCRKVWLTRIDYYYYY